MRVAMGWISTFASELFPCPEKYFYQRRLREVVRAFPNSESVTVVDVGCAKLKYRRLFGSRSYVGVDRDTHAMNEGLVRWNDFPQSSILEVDLNSETYSIPLGDLVVCGHTLSHLPEESRERALRNLVSAVCPGGALIFQAPVSTRLPADLDRRFRDVSLRTYGTPRSLWFSEVFANRTSSTSIPALFFVALGVVAAWPLSFVEPRARRPRSLLCIAKGKR
jgi:hypothetical protein